jgi:3-deoxy-manno-octulosonate cytidylyltransferase (CMP-KDO synthetase)
MKILGIIPARYGSSRFPGKPLADIHGKSMIQRVYEQSKKSSCLTEVIVATDDQRIANHVTKFKGKVLMTSDKHRNGTERCVEALNIWGREQNEAWQGVINIQGDEPFISPDDIDLVGKLLEQPGSTIATLVKRISSFDELLDPNVVKVVLNRHSEALYFSRSPIPNVRGEAPSAQWIEEFPFYKHLGIYGYASDILIRLPGLSKTVPEESESLEQLRWLGHGLKIKTAITDSESIAIDKPSDLLKITNIP